MDSLESLLSPLSVADLTLKNRVVMAPMNRRRAINGIPPSSAITYFGQRAGAGLIITDNTAITPNGKGYLHTPGIYNAEQKAAWKKVADEVHARGGKIIMQLVHTGRIGHVANNEDGSPLVAPSAVTARDTVRVADKGHLPISEPNPLSTTEVRELVEQHVIAAKDAIYAGFDGVEVHGAHGFLAEQFLHPYTNQRTDQYGGDIVNRSRFLLEIVEGISAAIGKERTGVRLSPYLKLNDLPPYAEERATQEYLTTELDKLDILYIHLSSGLINGEPIIPIEYIKDVRKRFKNLLILAGGFTAESAEAALRANLADLIAFGKPFIANPDLVERFRSGAALTEGFPEYFYEGNDIGYIDYPRLIEQN
ncbi:N-ethylmaleimide reductase [Mucilaginibacter gossypiicola]|uniref:N-ethylmaleimide reductase n=1 Tax=Mucilaginibacter gossypiicola TaxID=551995 RepID=A0A1H8CZC9_9SPHI|nr:alkene reductase [Mucilaginibacter gossypiicola]SEN00345.1 N-ethylmaleimide reductase [Mucilaginibacter gossypiicola]